MAERRSSVVMNETASVPPPVASGIPLSNNPVLPQVPKHLKLICASEMEFMTFDSLEPALHATQKQLHF
jgi:hypothetical protein